ncbi:hypothetical protein GN956_G12850 [Arapaima gigas]
MKDFRTHSASFLALLTFLFAFTHEDILSVPEGQSILLLLHATEPARVELFRSADQPTAVPVCESDGQQDQHHHQHKVCQCFFIRPDTDTA